MNTFQSLRLIHELYFKKGLPDLDLIQSYGLLAVKIGQLHALRLDFLPAERCTHLAQLYRAASPIPAEDIDTLLSAHGGPEFRKRFSSIDRDPIAVASVGQVYRATLSDGTPVAIKVIKKDFKERFSHDVAKLRRFFRLVIALYPRLRGVGDPLGILGDIEEYTTAELDLRNEMRGQSVLREFRDRYRESFDLSLLEFPKIYPEFSGENVLVSDFIGAPTVDELLSRGAFTYEDMLKLFYLQGFFMFKAGKFHGDFHPGNIMYDGKRFLLVDTAFVGEVGDRIRQGLFFFFEALTRSDFPNCAKFLNEMAETRIEGDAFAAFERAFIDLYRDFGGKTVSEVSLTRQMMLTIKLGVNSGMVFEKGIFAIIRSLMYLDGMVLNCNPDAVLMSDMRTFVTLFEHDV